ncbi:unnamed protein product [Victoria cruziana]
MGSEVLTWWWPEAQTQLVPRVVELLSNFRWPEAIVAAVCLYLIHTYRKQRDELVVDWPLVGMLPAALLNIHDLYEWTTKGLSIIGGTLYFRGPWFSGMEYLVTSDPRNIEYMLKTNFGNYPKGEEFDDIFRDLMGHGIFNSDADAWKAQRKVASTLVHSKPFRQFVGRTSDDMVRQKLVPLLNHAAQSGETINLQDVFLRFTFDSTCTAVFGNNPGCLSVGLPTVPFAKAIDDAMESILFRHALPENWWRLLRFLKLGKERQFAKSMAVVESFVEDQLAQRKASLDSHRAAGSGASSAVGDDLLSSYMAISGADTKFLRDTCVNFLIAGRDTSGVALSWFFWLLSKHPEIEAKLLQELSAIVRDRKEGDITFNHEDLQKMVYLQAALCESLRLYPSVPIGHKSVLKEDVLPSGDVVKPGIKILYVIYSVGRMEWVWGKDCLEFVPERWLDEDGRLKKQQISDFRFLAFNGGPRTCVGKEMAFVQMKYAAAQVLLNFEINVIESHPIVPKPSVIMSMKHGLMVKVKKRTNLPLSQ